METVSRDGVAIAFDRSGDGPTSALRPCRGWCCPGMLAGVDAGASVHVRACTCEPLSHRMSPTSTKQAQQGPYRRCDLLFGL